MKRPPKIPSRPPAHTVRRSHLSGYTTLLTDLKYRIRTAQIRAALSVNRELIQLYWDIGRAIVAKQKQKGWGAAVIDKLAADLQREFSDLSGFSRTNIYRMRAFYAAYSDDSAIVPEPLGQLPSGQEPSQFVAQSARRLAKKPARPIVPEPLGQLNLSQPPEPVASLPWSHNIALIESLSKNNVRLWYARKALENGWSHNMLAHWIDSDLYNREGKAVTNFKTTLPAAQSDLALQILKDPYNFDFLTLHHDAKEKDLETGLLEHITRFLIELGEGFAFVGRQMRFEVDGVDFSIDLLFYHLRLHAYFVVDLKTRKFEPADAGNMSFYLSTIDDQMRTPLDGPTLGLILCRTHSKVIAEYALRHLQRPVGVAGYHVTLTDKLPKELAGSLPSVKEIERELSRPSAARRRKRNK